MFAAATPSASGRGGLDVLHDVVRAASPALADAARAPRARRRASAASPACPATCARRGARAGRWSATPATGRTPSAPTASPTPSATPSSSPAPSPPPPAATRRGGRPRRTTTRPATGSSLPLFDVVDTIAAMRWTDEEIPGLLLPAQLGHERRGRARHQVPRRRDAHRVTSSATPRPAPRPSTQEPTMHIGDTARRTRTVTSHDIELFTVLTGDRNPLHYDEALAAATRFGGIVVQGGITTGLLNAVVAQDLPGPGQRLPPHRLELPRPGPPRRHHHRRGRGPRRAGRQADHPAAHRRLQPGRHDRRRGHRPRVDRGAQRPRQQRTTRRGACAADRRRPRSAPGPRLR